MLTPGEIDWVAIVELRVISRDSELFQVCGAILSDLHTPDPPWSVTTAAEDTGEPADIYVWDFRGDVPPSANTRWTYSNLMVVADRQDLAEVQKCFGFKPYIVLRPTSRAALSALIGPAVSSRTGVAPRDERDRIFQCLMEANLKLQEYDRERTRFLTRVVHDFRSPLTILNGYCGLLLSDPRGSANETEKEIIRRMQYSAKRLAHMVSAMLEVGIDRALRNRPNLQTADLAKSLDQVLQEIAYLAKEKDIRIDCHMEPCYESLYFDPGQLEQVFANILDNACKFVPRKGLIEIRGGPYFWNRRIHAVPAGAPPKERRSTDLNAPNSYRVDITDSGSPIPAEQLEIIFEESTSYAGGRDRSGGGLGLAICRTILDQHRGRIWAENTEKGPMFSFVLPVHKRIGQPVMAENRGSIGLEAQA